MSMREQCDVAADGAGTGYHPVYARAHLLRCFSARAAIPENQPTRRYLVDLLGRQALVLTVVPLAEIGIDHRLLAEARQLARFSCPLHGAAKNDVKPSLGENRSHPLCKPAAIVGQRDVRRPGMLPG